MKSKFFLIIFFISLCGNAQNKIQSHTNLNGLKCRTCHTCDIPTKENPCIIPCPRDKMYSVDLPPGDGPNVLTIDKFKKQTDVYAPVVFTHRLHAEMSGMSGGCKMCHHYNPPGQVIGCSDCHEITRKRNDVSKPDLKGAYHRQCMQCHRGWSKKVECESCHQVNSSKTQTTDQKLADANKKLVHPKITTPSIIKFETPKASGKLVTFYHSEHLDKFGLECQNCHSHESCLKCHDKTKSISTGLKSPERKHEVCSNCHDIKSNCNKCHANSVKGGFDHKEVTGFDISKFHGNLSCNRCHTSKGEFKGLFSECINCHGKWTNENFKHTITGITLDETHAALDCKDCHTEKNYSKPVCANCHDDKSFPKNIPGKVSKKK